MFKVLIYCFLLWFGAKNVSKIELKKWHFNTESYGLVVKVTPMLPYSFGPPPPPVSTFLNSNYAGAGRWTNSCSGASGSHSGSRYRGTGVLCVAARDGGARRPATHEMCTCGSKYCCRRWRQRMAESGMREWGRDYGQGWGWQSWREGVRPWRVAWLVLCVMWCNWLTGVAGTLPFGTVILVSIQQLEHERWGDLVRQLLAMHTSKKGSSLFSTSPTMMWSSIVNCSLQPCHLTRNKVINAHSCASNFVSC